MAPRLSREPQVRIRERVVPRPEPPFDRLYDPLVDDLLHGGPISRTRFATTWTDTAALTALAQAKRRPLPAPLAAALLDMHRRLGASAPSLASLERLARGEAVCTVAGQQPAPLGGPLYSLHKTACAVGLAVVVTERTGVPCVPVFWMHGEDSDFAEVQGATFADRALQVRDVKLPASAHREGELVGNVPAPPVLEAHAAALAAWEGLAGEGEVRAMLDRIAPRARDLGEVCSALMLELFGEHGLVVVDPRLPEFRAAARPLIDRYLAQADALSGAARAAGARLEAQLGRHALNDESLDSFVFAVEHGAREKVSADDARRRGAAATLVPSVALRPAVQDGVLPTVAMACGTAEIQYLAQLREVFEGVGVRPAAPVPRLTATWLPPAAVELIEASSAPAWDLVTGADRVLREHADRAVPAALRSELEDARTAVFGALDRYAQSSTRVDASLPQLVESARGKIDFQFARLSEALTGKVRHRLERQHPEWSRLRYYLLPGDRLQERRLASLEPVAYGGRAQVSELCALAAEQARRLVDGVHDHLLLELNT